MPDPAPPRPTVLLTGFDAFGGQTLNPSALAVQRLHGRQVNGHRIVAAVLPTVFDDSLRALDALLRRHRPALAIAVGQAGGRAAISIERVALNLNDAPLPDNAGRQPVDTPVCAGGPAAHFSGLPVKAVYAALRAEGIAAEVSQTAGTFVCNHVFYGLMQAIATEPALRHTRGGFIHVPWLPGQGTPHMALEDIERALAVVVRCALAVRQDAAHAAGATH